MIISRLLVEFYQDELIREKLLFRGGTALHKIHLSPAVRYSEDLDFVQRNTEGIGEALSVIKLDAARLVDETLIDFLGD